MSDNIEGNPFIIRFKTQNLLSFTNFLSFYIEGNPFIIRFKTPLDIINYISLQNIEGNPFIIRFKTSYMHKFRLSIFYILKVIHL